MPDDMPAPSTEHQRCEYWPLGTDRPCYAPAEWSIVTAWYVALRHGCYAHRDTLDQDVKVEHRVMPVSEWGAAGEDSERARRVASPSTP